MKNSTINQKEFCTSVFRTIIESTGGDFNGEGLYLIPSILGDTPIEVRMNDEGYYSYIKNSVTYDHLSLLKDFVGTDSINEAITFFSAEYYKGKTKLVSFFKAPIKNIQKNKDVDLTYIAKSIRDDKNNRVVVNRIREGVPSLKTQMLDYYTFSGTFNTRCLEGLLDYSGLICLDIDNVSNPSELQDKIIDLSIPLVLSFTSPSGNGLKAVLKSSSDSAKHLDYFYYYERLFQNELGIKIDKSCKDISRACFTSYDPNLYYIHPDFVNEIEIQIDKAQSILDITDRYIQNSLDGEKHTRLTKISFLLGGYHASGIIEKEEAISSLKRSIVTRGNLNDVDLAFKTIDKCFESGMREPISQEDIDKFLTYSDDNFDSMVNDVQPPVSLEYKLDNIVYTPTLYSRMPKNIQSIVNKVKSENNESFLLYTFLILSSGIFPKIDFNYGGSKHSLNLSNLTLADSASGKSATNLVKELFSDIDKFLGKEKVDNKQKSLFLSTNISGSELIHRIELNDGSVILYDTEISSFTSANSKEWGDYDTLFRQGASNDPIAQYRRDSKDVKVDFPKISIYLTGTPSQITSVFKDNLNGLYSRFMFFTFTGVDKWLTNLIFIKKQDLSEEKAYLLEVYNYYKKTPITLTMKLEAQELLDKHFSALFDKYNSDAVIKSVVVRHGIYAWKLCIIIKLFESFEKRENEIIVGEEAIELALEIVFKSLSVATDLSFNLKQENITNGQRLVKILRQLGNEFTRAEIVKYCDNIFKSTTIDKYLKDTSLFTKLEYGKYKLNR